MLPLRDIDDSMDDVTHFVVFRTNHLQDSSWRQLFARIHNNYHYYLQWTVMMVLPIDTHQKRIGPNLEMDYAREDAFHQFSWYVEPEVVAALPPWNLGPVVVGAAVESMVEFHQADNTEHRECLLQLERPS